jgi:hypothetical protein
MTALGYRIGVGENHYVACIVAPLEEPGGRSSGAADFRVLDIRDPLPPGGVTVSVPPGAQQVIAALRDVDENVPAGVTVTVRQPDGTAFSQSTEPYASNCVVQMENGSLTDLLVLEPEVGEWTVEVESTDPEADYQFFFSTLPTADVQGTIDATLGPMINPEARERGIAELGASWDCIICRVSAGALAITLLSLIAAGVAYVTAGAAPVAALAAFLGGISSQAAVALVVGLATAGSLSLSKVINEICAWAGACPSSAATR